jgi:hypothetical protein
VLGSNDRSTAACNGADQPSPLDRVPAKYQNQLTQANGIFRSTKPKSFRYRDVWSGEHQLLAGSAHNKQSQKIIKK